jgi:hypothetical protein
MARPTDMSRLEERAFDRYCANSEDPCKDLKAAVQQAILMARLKMNNMLNDPEGMYTKAFNRWTNHANDLSGRLESIAAMISLGQKMGCDMSAEATLAATLFVPTAPL